MISRICEMFGCLPSAAQRELDEDPDRLAVRIMDMRAFAHTHTAIQRARSAADAPHGPMAARVMDAIAARLAPPGDPHA